MLLGAVCFMADLRFMTDSFFFRFFFFGKTITSQLLGNSNNNNNLACFGPRFFRFPYGRSPLVSRTGQPTMPLYGTVCAGVSFT